MKQQIVIGILAVALACGAVIMVVASSLKPSVGSKPTSYAAHGKFVFKNGEPVRDTFVNFIPTVQGQGWPCQAQTRADGTFEVASNFTPGTNKPDGAVPGEYACSFEQGAPTKFTNGQKTNPSIIHKKYQDLKTSGITVVIKAEDNDLGTIKLE